MARERLRIDSCNSDPIDFCLRVVWREEVLANKVSIYFRDELRHFVAKLFTMLLRRDRAPESASRDRGYVAALVRPPIGSNPLFDCHTMGGAPAGGATAFMMVLVSAATETASESTASCCARCSARSLVIELTAIVSAARLSASFVRSRAMFLISLSRNCSVSCSRRSSNEAAPFWRVSVASTELIGCMREIVHRVKGDKFVIEIVFCVLAAFIETTPDFVDNREIVVMEWHSQFVSHTGGSDEYNRCRGRYVINHEHRHFGQHTTIEPVVCSKRLWLPTNQKCVDISHRRGCLDGRRNRGCARMARTDLEVSLPKHRLKAIPK